VGAYSGLKFLTPGFWAKVPHVASEPQARAWIEHLARRHYADATQFSYAADLNAFLEFLGDVAYIDVEPDVTEAYEQYLVGLRVRRVRRVVSLTERRLYGARHLANSTLNRRMLVPDLWYNYLLAKGVCRSNPFTGLLELGSRAGRRRFLRTSDDQQPVWLPTTEEWRSLQTVINSPFCTERDRFMLLLSYDCALRVSELVMLELDDVHFAVSKDDVNHIEIRSGKGKKNRTIPFTDALMPAFESYLVRRAEITRARGPLFISESRRNFGEPITASSWQKRIAHIRGVAGLPRLTTHSMRHLCLTDLARAGEDLLYIAAFAGHKSFESSQRYIHLAAQDLVRSVHVGMRDIREWRSRTLARPGRS